MTNRRPAVHAVRALWVTRGVRAAADGLVAASLAVYLTDRGLSESEIGRFLTVTLLGSASIVAMSALRPMWMPPRRMLLTTSALMMLVGVGFALRWPIGVLVACAMIGPLNPGGGDVSAFLPAEQTLLTAAVPAERRTSAFARFTLFAAIGATIGGLAAGVPDWLEDARGWSRVDALSAAFWAYAAIGALVGTVYLINVRGVIHGTSRAVHERLVQSRRVVGELSALFALDSGGGGFVLSGLLALWLDRRFGFDLSQLGFTLAAMSLLSAVSAMTAPRLVRRMGHVRTMVFTHVPAQVFLIAAALAPTATIAVAFLMLRALTATLDVPARSAFVMSVVSPAERAAAASMTNVPRALAAALTPAVAGWMLSRSTFGWPLICGGLIKLVYDGLLYVRFRHLDVSAAD